MWQKNQFHQVLSLFIDESIPAQVPFAEVKEKAFSLLEQDRFAAVSDYMRNLQR